MTLNPSKLLDREPVMFMALVQSGIALLTAFGLNLTGDQVGAIMAFTAALVGFVVRQQVTPVPPASVVSITTPEKPEEHV